MELVVYVAIDFDAPSLEALKNELVAYVAIDCVFCFVLCFVLLIP
jgi:hypothetical protein